MRVLHKLFEQNRAWAKSVSEKEPDFFERLSRQQAPEYLWIGCSDSRVPANQIVGLQPGEMFVHRNVANVVGHSDLNCLSVLHFAVEVLQVRDVIVCGHYGCGGVLSALRNEKVGLVDNWLRHVQDVHHKHASDVETRASEKEKHDRLCELNVIEQVRHVCATTVVQEAWRRGHRLNIHSWIYSLKDGLLKDLGMCVSEEAQVEVCYRQALSAASAT